MKVLFPSFGLSAGLKVKLAEKRHIFSSFRTTSFHLLFSRTLTTLLLPAMRCECVFMAKGRGSLALWMWRAKCVLCRLSAQQVLSVLAVGSVGEPAEYLPACRQIVTLLRQEVVRKQQKKRTKKKMQKKMNKKRIQVPADLLDGDLPVSLFLSLSLSLLLDTIYCSLSIYFNI